MAHDFEAKWAYLNEHIIATCDKWEIVSSPRGCRKDCIPLTFAWDVQERRVYALTDRLWHGSAGNPDGRGIWRWMDAKNLEDAKNRMRALFAQHPHVFTGSAWTQA